MEKVFNKFDLIPDPMKEKIRGVAQFLGGETTNWISVKYILLRSMHNKYKVLFSKRHPKTKNQVPNDFDKLVMDYWKELTGVELTIPVEKLHHPSQLKNKRGWGLHLWQEEQRKRKEETQKNEQK